MKAYRILKTFHFLAFVFLLSIVKAQIPSGVYFSEDENKRHELKIDQGYLTHTIYKTEPAEFIKAVGGFFSADDNKLKVTLEFNSAYEQDGIKELEIPYTLSGERINLKLDKEMAFDKREAKNQALDGQWLFATRGPDTGQDRRGEKNPRKTLKFLLDGRFQWIAYQTETMRFSGTGGGSFTAEDGVYTENIEFFSRDNDRVGASLKFNFEIKGDDWHHTGKNSKGEPMYEIWAKRN